jgi:hypothetical protein
MGVASCRSIFLLSNVVFNHASVSPRFGFRFAIGFRPVVVCVVGFHPDLRPSPARPSPARPRAPLAPHSPSLSFGFPTQQLPLPLLPFFHLFALGDPVDGYRRFLDPKVSSPLLSLSLSLSLSLPFPLPRACPWPLARASLHGPRPPAARLRPPRRARPRPPGVWTLAPAARPPWPRGTAPGPGSLAPYPGSARPLPVAARRPCSSRQRGPAARPVPSRARSPSVRDV